MTTTYSEHLVTQIRQYVADDDLARALEQLANLSSSLPSLYDEVLLQQSRRVRLERDIRRGILTHEAADVAANRLKLAVLSLVDELKARWTTATAPVVPPPISESAVGEQKGVAFEKILGINNLKQISWIAKGLTCARSVCRVLTPGGVGSGFLVAPDLLMTNNHVIASADTAMKTLVEFNYQQDGSGGYESSCRYQLNANRFRTSPKAELDYTVVGVQADDNLPPLTTWGHLTLNTTAVPVLYEHVSIIQHPNGGFKQIAMTGNQAVGVEGHYLRYSTDTMPGSSGSPVFNDSWQVVAIHHAAAPDGKSNEGILMSYVQADMKKAGFSWAL
jgi:endonuclease G